MSTSVRSGPLAALLTLAPVAALAHPGHGAHGLAAGLMHPLSGADHVLAMTAVGLWAALRGGRAMVAWPAAFLAAMPAGFVAGGLVGGGLHVEPIILASVVVLGAGAAADVRAPTALGAALIAAFGLAHGWAHGAEASGAGFGAGMSAATIVLILGGVIAGLALKRLGRPDLARWLGAAAMAGGLALAVTA